MTSLCHTLFGSINIVSLDDPTNFTLSLRLRTSPFPFLPWMGFGEAIDNIMEYPQFMLSSLSFFSIWTFSLAAFFDL